MRCVGCGSAAVTRRPERTARGYRRFRCRDCHRQFNERSTGHRTQYPSDVITLVVFWRLRYKLSLRDLAEMFLSRGIVFSHKAVRDWEMKLTPALTDKLRRRRHHRIGPSWHVDETYIKVHGQFVSRRRGERHAVRKMKEGPSEPPCRRRLQTAMSCFGRKAAVVNVMVKGRGKTASCEVQGDERERTFDEASLGLSGIKTEAYWLSRDEHGRYLPTGHVVSGVQKA